MRFVSPTQLEGSLPSLDRIGWVDVEVTNPDLQCHKLEAAYELQGPPQLATVQPREGSAVGGDLLTLNGLGFDRRCEVSIQAFRRRPAGRRTPRCARWSRRAPSKARWTSC